MTPLRQRMIDDMTLHGLKPKTIRAYVACIARFARHFGKSPELLGTAEIRSYLLYLTHDRHVSSSTYKRRLRQFVARRKDWHHDRVLKMTVMRGGVEIPCAEREKMAKNGETRDVESDSGTRIGRVKLVRK